MFSFTFFLVLFYFIPKYPHFKTTLVKEYFNDIARLRKQFPSEANLCLRPINDRYDYMKDNGHGYTIIINLYDNDKVINHLSTQLILVILSYWKTDNVFVSIYDYGHNSKHTHLLSTYLSFIHVHHYIEQVDQQTTYSVENSKYTSNHELYHHTIILNDVYFCKDDLLELVHQRNIQSADMVSGLEFEFKKKQLGYHHTYTMIDLDGNPPNDNLNDLLVHKPSQQSLLLNKPIQMMCIWNGIIVMNPLVFKTIRFKRKPHNLSNCNESSRLCSTMIHKGYTRIILIPNVHFTHSLTDFKLLKSTDPIVHLFDPLSIRKSSILVNYTIPKTSPCPLKQQPHQFEQLLNKFIPLVRQ